MPAPFSSSTDISLPFTANADGVVVEAQPLVELAADDDDIAQLEEAFGWLDGPEPLDSDLDRDVTQLERLVLVLEAVRASLETKYATAAARIAALEAELVRLSCFADTKDDL